MPGRLSPSPEAENVDSLGSNFTGEKERLAAVASRMRLKDPPFARRRKISVPELGPMTTVQEVTMDSREIQSSPINSSHTGLTDHGVATIPGRPPIHERSISAPGTSWRQNAFGEAMVSFISGPMIEEPAEITSEDPKPKPRAETPTMKSRSNSPKQPLSPKVLTPLIIPSNSTSQQPIQQCTLTRKRSESTPPEVPPKSARMLDRGVYTPMSASTSNLSSATTVVTPNSVSRDPRQIHGVQGQAPWVIAVEHLKQSTSRHTSQRIEEVNLRCR